MTGETRQVTLADIGEGLTEAFITRILVNVGDMLKQLDPIAEVETDKALIEITTPWSGRVEKILVEVESWVNVGDAVLELAVER